MPPFLLLLLLGGAAAASRPKKKKRVRFDRIDPKTIQSVVEATQLVRAFSGVKATEYPAPYTWRDAKDVIDWLLEATAEHAPVFKGEHQKMKARYAALKKRQRSMPNAEKVYVAIWWIVIPILFLHLTWWWYRPRTDRKKEQLAAVVQWVTGFWLSPQTATVAARIDPSKGGSSIPFIESYRVTSPLIRGGLTLEQQGRALLDVHNSIIEEACQYSHKRFGGTINCKIRDQSIQRVANRLGSYTIRPGQTAEDNLIIAEETIWASFALNEASITAPDPADLLIGIVLNFVAIAIIVAAPFLGPAVGAAQTALASVTAALTEVAGAAAATAAVGAVQAAVGSAVAYGLSKTGVVQWLTRDDDVGDTLRKLQKLEVDFELGDLNLGAIA